MGSQSGKNREGIVLWSVPWVPALGKGQRQGWVQTEEKQE